MNTVKETFIYSRGSPIKNRRIPISLLNETTKYAKISLTIPKLCTNKTLENRQKIRKTSSPN